MVEEKDPGVGSERQSDVDETEHGSIAPYGMLEDTSSDGNAVRIRHDTPIQYLWLTFQTSLPAPACNVKSSSERQVPPCPNLKPYQSPLIWSPARKGTALALAIASTFFTAYAASAYSPPSKFIAQSYDVSHVAVLVGITTFCIGFSFAPMALAPVSEIWGRYPVFFVAGIIFVAFQAICSVMPDLAGMLVARFFVGVGGSVFSSVMAGVLADLWRKEDRNTPMALFSGAVLGGTGAGPLVSTAFVDQMRDKTLAWKWCFWHQTVIGAVLVTSIIVFFRESRANVLLARKAKLLNRWYEELERSGVYGVRFKNGCDAEEVSSRNGQTLARNDSQDSSQRSKRIRWLVKEVEDRASLTTLVATSVKRPFYLLFTEPVVFWFSLWAAFAWAVLYLSFSVVPYLYGTDLNKTSRVYIALIVASIVATTVSIYLDKLLQHPQWKHNPDAVYSDSKFWAFLRRRFPAEAPEARLYFACVTCLFLPAGLFGGLISNHSAAPAIGLGFATWGIYSVYLSTFNYLADSYHVYASSALAAQGFARNMLGGAFPLITKAMFDKLGVKGAGGMLGGIAMLLSVTPWILMIFGERIRAKSSVMKSLAQ